MIRSTCALFWFFVPFLCLTFSNARAQDGDTIRRGAWHLEPWIVGAKGVSGTESGTGLLAGGFRAGRVLTSDFGPGFLRGNFEYAVDLVPVYVFDQAAKTRTGMALPADTSYGAGLNPLILKWNFAPHSRWKPYFELGGGLVWTNNDLPQRTSSLNFSPQTGFGFHYFHRDNQAWTASVKYVHYSNGGLKSPNPGVNTVQLLLGYSWWK